ncbi:MAG: nucleoid-associated protein [Paludibacteraceae bacterium]|nr:nucleoid-associated protein [Candidatus Physcocola equi]MCQ2233502.1 nucleoid-associated protein [Paludibacteraceae bacterium]
MIFDIVNAQINKLVIHKIGSHADNTNNVYSKGCLQFSEDSPIPGLLKQFFLATFNEPNLYHLDSEEGVAANMVYKVASDIFASNETFYENSRVLADLLYKNSTNPNIKQGEFYLTLFEDVKIFDETVDCIGIFKSETKETFLKICPDNDLIGIDCEEGINIKKLDKGCLIFNIEKENGYVVSVVDKVSKANEAAFWKTDFLGLSVREDNNYDTLNYLNVCKRFVDEVYSQKNEVPRENQIDLQNRTIDYFKSNDAFNEDLFKQEVLDGEETIIQAFDEHKANFEQENGVTLNREFPISNDVVKKENKRFKSVIKLDKNFHIYVHGNERRLERGFDNNLGLHYYKLYYETES